MMMNSLVDVGIFHGYRIGVQEGVHLTHLQFTDDTLIIDEKSRSNVRPMRAILLVFEAVSDLRVNFRKSMLMGVNVAKLWLNEAASVMNCQTSSIPFVYVGMLVGLVFGNL